MREILSCQEGPGGLVLDLRRLSTTEGWKLQPGLWGDIVAEDVTVVLEAVDDDGTNGNRE